MPVFQDPDRRQDRPWDRHSPATFSMPGRRTSEESIRTEFCDGPLLDDPASDGAAAVNRTLLDALAREDGSVLSKTNDRETLIQRIKRGEKPTWAPNCKDEPFFSELEVSLPARNGSIENQHHNLLPAIELKQEPRTSIATADNPYSNSIVHDGFQIERPRSALHAGDFTDTSSERNAYPNEQTSVSEISNDMIPIRALATSPSIAWTPPLIKNQSHPLQVPRTPYSQAVPINFDPTQENARSRSSSLHSFSSSFILKAPTSPLVQEASNDDLDSSAVDRSFDNTFKENRRHTMPIQTLQSLRSLPSGLAQAARQPASVQRESSFPIRSHHARRSLTLVSPFLHSSSPPTPNFSRSRRPSYSGDASPLQHASMVGSYEESILRGRMSTTPSKPVDFTAQIGALGFGDCKPKYPAHVTLEFPASYYNWSNGNRGIGPVSDEPSPYVGQIDLEHKLPPPERKEKRSRRTEALQMDDQDALSESSPNSGLTRRKEKRKRRSTSPTKVPVGGSYRIPQKGQLQILIKNPNKTAVKLFLVPYDLEGMEAGTKTFVRQKCYSAGPVVENAISSKPVQESGRDSKTSLPNSKPKPAIRYMVHLHICCPAKGRFYLYRTINVVFANRVPDNKERLQNEIRLPEPRYSPYKPSGEQQLASLSFEAKRAMEKQYRRRSYGFGTSARTSSFETPHGMHFSPGKSFSLQNNSDIPPVPSIPFDFITPEKVDASPGTPPQSAMDLDVEEPSAAQTAALQSPLSDKVSRIAAAQQSGSIRSNSSSNSNDSYSKLCRGDAGYGGVFGRPDTPEPGEGLLARRLRGLDVEKARKDYNG